MMQMDPGNNYRVRQLKRPLNLGEDAVYYVSLMTRQEFLSASAVQPRRQESTRLSFRSQDNFWSDRISLAIPPHLRPHVEIADGIRFTGPTAVSAGHTLLWVAKIVARHDGDDEVFLRLYHEGESLDFVEPADWSVIGRGLRSHAKLDLVLLTGTGQSRHWFDELRIGTSWRAVVPIAEPVVLPVAADSPRKRLP